MAVQSTPGPSAHERARSWEAVWNTHVNGLAEDWFGRSLISTRDVWVATYPELGRALQDEGDYIADTPLAANFLLAQGAGLRRPQSGATLTPIAFDEADVDGRITGILSELGIASFRVGDTLHATWPTAHGGDVVVTGEACLDADRRVHVYWYSSPLVSSQPLPRNDLAAISVVAAVPLALQTAVYLAENPLPANPNRVDRATLMGMVWPGPFIEPESRMVMDTRFLARLDASGLIHGFHAPVRIDVGYPIPADCPEPDIATGIRIAVNTAIQLTGIFEDGYLNHPAGEIGFQATLTSQAAQGPSGRPRGVSVQEWFPPTRARDYLDVLQLAPLA
jgi:hypothetical protein